MMRSRVALVLAAVLVVAGGATLLLVRGPDGPQTSSEDEAGDVSEDNGEQTPQERQKTASEEEEEEADDASEDNGAEAPEETGLADIEFAEVRSDGSHIVFEARSAADVPKKLTGGAMSWRWDILDGGEPAWILSANLDIGPNATIFNPDTDFGAGTVDGSFPGEVNRAGSSLIIRMDPRQLAGFPEEFEWKLETTLEAGDGADSTVVRDSAPPQGVGEFTRN